MLCYNLLLWFVKEINLSIGINQNSIGFLLFGSNTNLIITPRIIVWGLKLASHMHASAVYKY